MARGDIRQGSEDGSVLIGRPNPDKGPYFVDGNGAVPHGPFDFYDVAEARRKQVLLAFEQNRGAAVNRDGRNR